VNYGRLRRRIDALAAAGGGGDELSRLRAANVEENDALALAQREANAYRVQIGDPPNPIVDYSMTDADLLRWAHRTPEERHADEMRRLRDLYGAQPDAA
jgi:hypothetical protein